MNTRTSIHHDLRWIACLPLLAALCSACSDDGGPIDDQTQTSGPSGDGDGDAPGDGDGDAPGDGDAAGDGDGDASGDGDGDPEPECVAQIELPGETFYPEGTAWSHSGALYVASLSTGEVVVAADPCGGTLETLIEADSALRNPVGMLVDDARGLLLVCDSNFDFDTPPELDVFDLASGELVASHPFLGVGFCNDLALDGEGNLYATDSTAARIVRVSTDGLASDDSPAEDWASDPDFAVEEGEFGLNGVVYDGADALYVVNFAQGELHRVTIEAGGEAGMIEALDLGDPLASPDGMKWDGDTLLLIEGGKSALSRLDLAGASPVAQVVRDGFSFPTTFALIDGRAWVAEGQLDHFLGLDEAPPELPFVVTRVDL